MFGVAADHGRCRDRADGRTTRDGRVDLRLNRFSVSTSVGSTPAVSSTGIFTTLVVSPGAKVKVLASAT
jgi:hypothetical protein